MNYAGRFNSFILKGQNVFDAIKAYHEMDASLFTSSPNNTD